MALRVGCDRTIVPSMWWLILLGFVAGGLVMLLPWRRARREADAAETARRKLAEDRARWVGFTRELTEAVEAHASRPDLHQRLVRAVVRGTDAASGCFFELGEGQTLRGVAREGLFPPQRPLTDEARRQLRTRVRFIELVLQPEEFPVGEGVVGQVAGTRRGELLRDAASDPRWVKHEDPALAVGSVIAVPVKVRERLFGVLAVATPAGEPGFDDGDLELVQALAEQAAWVLQSVEAMDR